MRQRTLLLTLIVISTGLMLVNLLWMHRAFIEAERNYNLLQKPIKSPAEESVSRDLQARKLVLLQQRETLAELEHELNLRTVSRRR